MDSFDADRSKGGRSHETYQPFVFDACRSPQYPVFVVLVDVVVIAILVVAIVIPDICQFWYTIALFQHVSVSAKISYLPNGPPELFWTLLLLK